VKAKDKTHVAAKAWDEDARGVWARHVTARRTLETVVPVFEKAGIEVLAVKGIVTAYTLYAEPAERPLSDVDVRIRPEDFERAAGVAEEAGWPVVQWQPGYGSFVLFIGTLGLNVDVESVIGAPGLCKLSIGEMLSRAKRGLHGSNAWVPELHDHAVLLCVNVFKDKLALAAPWALEDVRRIAEADGFVAGTFVERARAAKIASIAWIVADWMVREKKSVAWARVKAKLGGERAPRPLYAWAFRRLQERAPRSMVTRLLARVGPDDPGMWMEGLWRAGEIEMGRLRK
jgi:acetolactate synthase regulatory subunit